MSGVEKTDAICIPSQLFFGFENWRCTIRYPEADPNIPAARMAVAGDALRLDLEDLDRLGTRIEAGEAVKTEGAGSIRVTTAHPTREASRSR